MLTPLKSEILKVDDLSHEVRRFRTILWSFERNEDLLFKNAGLVAVVNQEALAEAFSRWRKAFDNSEHLANVDRQDFAIYAASLMLKELIVAAPLNAHEDSSNISLDIDQHLKRWPEDYACTSFCLSVASAVLKEMAGAEPISTLKRRVAILVSSRKCKVRIYSASNFAWSAAFASLIVGRSPFAGCSSRAMCRTL